MIKRASGSYVTDIHDNTYLDCLSGYSAINQGHGHPRLRRAISRQIRLLNSPSRIFHNAYLGRACRYMSDTFGFERALFMNSGVEAVETAIRFARKWGYVRKGIRPGRARVLFAEGNFWGRSIAACASSEDPYRHAHFGPYRNYNFDLVPFNSVPELRRRLESSPDYCAFVVEPIQGEGGVVMPSEGYLRAVRRACDEFGVLLVVDEIQTGLGRAGRLLCQDALGARGDLVTVGKALSGGFMAVSCVLGSSEVFDLIGPGEHGSTFAGNALAATLAENAVQVLLDEKLIENSRI